MYVCVWAFARRRHHSTSTRELGHSKDGTLWQVTAANSDSETRPRWVGNWTGTVLESGQAGIDRRALMILYSYIRQAWSIARASPAVAPTISFIHEFLLTIFELLLLPPRHALPSTLQLTTRMQCARGSFPIFHAKSWCGKLMKCR